MHLEVRAERLTESPLPSHGAVLPVLPVLLVLPGVLPDPDRWIGPDRPGAAWIGRGRRRGAMDRCGSMWIGLDRWSPPSFRRVGPSVLNIHVISTVGPYIHGGATPRGVDRSGPVWIGLDRCSPPSSHAGVPAMPGRGYARPDRGSADPMGVLPTQKGFCQNPNRLDRPGPAWSGVDRPGPASGPGGSVWTDVDRPGSLLTPGRGLLRTSSPLEAGLPFHTKYWRGPPSLRRNVRREE